MNGGELQDAAASIRFLHNKTLESLKQMLLTDLGITHAKFCEIVPMDVHDQFFSDFECLYLTKVLETTLGKIRRKDFPRNPDTESKKIGHSWNQELEMRRENKAAAERCGPWLELLLGE